MSLFLTAAPRLLCSVSLVFLWAAEARSVIPIPRQFAGSSEQALSRTLTCVAVPARQVYVCVFRRSCVAILVEFERADIRPFPLQRKLSIWIATGGAVRDLVVSLSYSPCQIRRRRLRRVEVIRLTRPMAGYFGLGGDAA